MTDFLFDPDDLTPKTFPIPVGVDRVHVWAVGGGEAIGWTLSDLLVTPGDDLIVDLGGPPSEFGTEGGYGGGGRTGGEGGGGYEDPNGARGLGGGGATELRRSDDSVLAVAGGAGGVAGGTSYFEDFYPLTAPAGVPSAAVAPRAVVPQPFDTTTIAYDLWTLGNPGGELVGAAGIYIEADVEDGTYWGGGGGGGGYGGGSSGGVGFYHYVLKPEPVPEGTFGAVQPGRAGASLVPADVFAWSPWRGIFAGDGIYSSIDGRPGGFVRIEASEGPSQAGWNVGRLRM